MWPRVPGVSGSGSVHTVARVGASPLFAAATAPRVRPSLDDGRPGCFHRSAVLETAAVCTSIFAFPNTWRLCVEPDGTCPHSRCAVPRSHEQRATPAAARPGRRPAAPASDPSRRVPRAISPRLCFCLPDGWLRRASSRELVVLLCIFFGETSGQTLLLSLNWNHDYEVLIYSRQVSPVRRLTCECPLRFCGSSFSFAQWCSLNHERFFCSDDV